MGLTPGFGLCPKGFRPKAGPGGLAPTFSGTFYGEAERRLTSGGEAGAMGVKFRIGSQSSRRYLTSGGEAGAMGVKFRIGSQSSRRYLTRSEEHTSQLQSLAY